MTTERNGKILVIGAVGQVGRSLTRELRARVGADRVVAAGRATEPPAELRAAGPFEKLDATDKAALDRVIRRHAIGTIYHLAAVLSADGEKDPVRAWTINVESLRNVLDLAVAHSLAGVFWPSSIAAFGPTTPRENTPQRTVLEPTTLYGVTKVLGENLCHYYFKRHGLDVRSLRYPGLLTYETYSGGGTSDYSVEMFIEALRHGRYTCFVRPDTTMPLMYIDDAVRATIELMQAPAQRISIRTSYNLTALSFSAAELAAEVARRVPGFVCDYQPNFRQAIADSWPRTIDDSAARQDWGWQPRVDLAMLCDTMLRGVADMAAKGVRL
ncbi:MAG: NAD-dependent epimerase/dehydratase family protein [Alphaproteobacteria bacterium]|nr:NAD-dependent epimerase/dehydratase family protein [Alphaproteobacteria bacterium]